MHALYNSLRITLSSLLLVRKSVEGFRIVVIALASSSCTVLPVAVLASVINTYYTQTSTSINAQD